RLSVCGKAAGRICPPRQENREEGAGRDSRRQRRTAVRHFYLIEQHQCVGQGRLPTERHRRPDGSCERIAASLSSSAVQGCSSMADVEIVLHPIPTPQSKPYIIVFGPDQHLWFCESGTSKIGRMNPSNSSFIEFDTPTPNSRPIGITPAADG